MKILLIGQFSNSIGISKDAFALYKCLDNLDYEVFIYDYIPNGSQSSTVFNLHPNLANKYANLIYKNLDIDIVIYALPLPYSFNAFMELSNFVSDKKNIVYPPLEVTNIPEEYKVFLKPFDLIIVNSDYIKGVLENLDFSLKNIIKWTTYIEIFDAEKLKCGKHFPFILDTYKVKIISAFDYNSRSSRKNAESNLYVLRQLSSLYPENLFVLKTVNKPNTSNAYLSCINSNLVELNETLSDIDFAKLLSSSDLYLSQHRSEGYGRICAEAMGYGALFVGTGNTGVLEFADEFNSILLDYEVTSVKPWEYPSVTKYSTWAEIDPHYIFEKMCNILDNFDTYNSYKIQRENAKAFIRKRNSLENASLSLKKILNSI